MDDSVVIRLLYLPQAQLVVVAFLNDVCTSVNVKNAAIAWTDMFLVKTYFQKIISVSTQGLRPF